MFVRCNSFRDNSPQRRYSDVTAWVTTHPKGDIGCQDPASDGGKPPGHHGVELRFCHQCKEGADHDGSLRLQETERESLDKILFFYSEKVLIVFFSWTSQIPQKNIFFFTDYIKNQNKTNQSPVQWRCSQRHTGTRVQMYRDWPSSPRQSYWWPSAWPPRNTGLKSHSWRTRWPAEPGKDRERE